MNAVILLLIAVGMYALGGVAALVWSRTPGRAVWAAGICGAAGAVLGVVAAGAALTAGAPPELAFVGVPPFGNLIFTLDGLSAFLVGVISLVGFAVSVYSIAYLQGHSHAANPGVVAFFGNLFVAAMLLVVAVANAFYFLIFWELMTLLSYFLVIYETGREESIRAGYLYFLIAHAGSALILVSFLILFQNTGSMDFAAFRQAALPGWVKNLVFLLAFIGFGAKAGMIPLHIWLPRAHPAAPSHISALMSGVMIKTAVYGILRVAVDFLGAPDAWWGLTVAGFGAASAVLGILYALAESDLKKLLAYSSVENIGVILMGVGAGMVGVAAQAPLLAVLGFLAALYHLLNHAFFKSLLFLNAGAVISQARTQNLNHMGGLARRMPFTALTFLIAALSVAAIPPLNGFVSEWFTYQAFLAGGQSTALVARALLPLCAVALALAGAFTLMVYVKAYAGAFAGPARNPAAETAAEAPGLMRFSAGYLAIGCFVLGIGAPWIAPLLARIAAGVAGVPPIETTNAWQVFPGDPARGVLSPLLVALLLLGLLVVPPLLAAAYGGGRAGRRSGAEPWSCGYGYSPAMSASAASFDQPARSAYLSLYQARRVFDRPWQALRSASAVALSWIRRAEPVIETVISRPAIRLVETAGQWVQALQMGDIRVYCLYIILTLAILLLVSFGRSGL